MFRVMRVICSLIIHFIPCSYTIMWELVAWVRLGDAHLLRFPCKSVASVGDFNYIVALTGRSGAVFRVTQGAASPLRSEALPWAMCMLPLRGAKGAPRRSAPTMVTLGFCGEWGSRCSFCSIFSDFGVKKQGYFGSFFILLIFRMLQYDSWKDACFRGESCQLSRRN